MALGDPMKCHLTPKRVLTHRLRITALSNEHIMVSNRIQNLKKKKNTQFVKEDRI